MIKPTIAIVMPCFNEQAVLPISMKEILRIIDKMSIDGLVSPNSYILCVDDGSKDNTWETINRLHAEDKRLKGISLAHNSGHQFALLAGLMEVKNKCDAAISIDADLQDDPSAIVEMVRKYGEGYEIVYGVRANRKKDTWFKRHSAHAFYKLQRKMGIEAVYDHADFRLMSARAIDILSRYSEQNLFLRGIVPQIGLKSTTVEYERGVRTAGESKYPLGKMLRFSVDGITSFSSSPMKWILYAGLIFLVLDIAVSIYALISHICGNTIAGWTTIMLSVWFIGSLMLLSLGIIGIYIGKIYMEAKRRPRYYVSDRTE